MVQFKDNNNFQINKLPINREITILNKDINKHLKIIKIVVLFKDNHNKSQAYPNNSRQPIN